MNNSNVSNKRLFLKKKFVTRRFYQMMLVTFRMKNSSSSSTTSSSSSFGFRLDLGAINGRQFLHHWGRRACIDIGGIMPLERTKTIDCCIVPTIHFQMHHNVVSNHVTLSLIRWMELLLILNQKGTAVCFDVHVSFDQRTFWKIGKCDLFRTARISLHKQ